VSRTPLFWHKFRFLSLVCSGGESRKNCRPPLPAPPGHLLQLDTSAIPQVLIQAYISAYEKPSLSLVLFSFLCYIFLMSITQKDQVPDDSVAEASPSYADDGLDYEGECPICAAHNYMPNAETIAVIEESRAMLRGEIPSTLRRFQTLEEMLEDLDRDDPDDMDD
jgi:hypothetical protein